MRALAGASEAEVESAAREAAPPSPRTVSVHLVEAVTGDRSVRVRAVTEPMAAWGIGGGIVSTAAPMAAAVRMLARGEVGATGALPPERCLDPQRLFAQLAARGCRVEINKAEVAA